MRLPSPAGQREWGKAADAGPDVSDAGRPRQLTWARQERKGCSSSVFQTAGHDPLVGHEINSVGHDQQLFLI